MKFRGTLIYEVPVQSSPDDFECERREIGFEASDLDTYISEAARAQRIAEKHQNEYALTE